MYAKNTKDLPMDRSGRRHPPPGDINDMANNRCVTCVYDPGELVLKCKICGKIKVFKCEYCQVYLLSEGQMKEHGRRKHAEEIANLQKKRDQSNNKNNAASNGTPHQSHSSSASSPATDNIAKNRATKLRKKAGEKGRDGSCQPDSSVGLWTCSNSDKKAEKEGDAQGKKGPVVPVRALKSGNSHRLFIRKTRQRPSHIPSNNVPNGEDISEGASRQPNSSSVPPSADNTDSSLKRDDHLPVKEEPVAEAITESQPQCSNNTASDGTPHQSSSSSVSPPAIDTLMKEEEVEKDDREETFRQPDFSPIESTTADKVVQKDNLQVKKAPLIHVPDRGIANLSRSTLFKRKQSSITGNVIANCNDVSERKPREPYSFSTAGADQEEPLPEFRKNCDLFSSRRATLRERKDAPVHFSFGNKTEIKVDRDETLHQSNSPTVSTFTADITVNTIGIRVPWEMANARVILEDFRLANSRRSTLRKRNRHPLYFPTCGNRTNNKGEKHGMLCKSDSSKVSSSAGGVNVNNDAPNHQVIKTDMNDTISNSSRKRKRNPVYFPTYEKASNAQCGSSSVTKGRNKNSSQRVKKEGRPLKRKNFFQNKNYIKERKYCCQYCPTRFKHRAFLIVHLRIHTGERPYKCQYCPKAFSQATSCNNHMRIHTNERPFVCKTCNKSFRQVSNLIFHERIHAGIKAYECETCGKKFVQLANRNAHRRVHH